MRMRTIVPISTQLLISFFCLLTFSIGYSQEQKTTEETLFGKPITAKSKNPNDGKIRCATVEYEQYLQERNPNRMTNAQFEAWLNPLISKQKNTKKNYKVATSTIITIPVVVHIVHSGQNIGTAPNITDAQVQSQITVLNQDFRKMLGSPGYNTNPVGADIEIEFVLAKQDPNGNPTNGIDRVSFLQQSWSTDDIEKILKPATIWDPSLYLNMWCLKFTDNTVLGYAQFPDGSGLGGLNTSGGDINTDGVVSSYDVFGSSALGTGFILASPFDKGRTMTHEVGHFLGLLHIWGDGTGHPADPTAKPPVLEHPDCTATDYCNDTPAVGWVHYECGTFDTCPTYPGNDMPENYMDYTPDSCMNIFTQNQKDRMMVIMNNANRRKSLKTSTKGDAITLNEIDAEIKLLTFNSNIDYACSTPPAPQNKQVSINNRGTSVINTVTLNYNINGGANQSYNWTGSLTQNQSANITLPNTNSNGTLNVSIVTTNDVTDQRTSNNADSMNYFDKIPPNYNYNNYTLNLQLDLWGSETSWFLKDSSGNIIDKNDPYTDSTTLPALITKNWTLNNNQCYTFIINDTRGDGICCRGGDGYYELKTNNGAITVKSGGSFSSTETTTFTTNTLGTNEFETSSQIYLHPNPTKGTITIAIPANFGLPNSYTINSILGQKISQKEISNQTDLTINTSDLSNGIYFITLVKEDQKRTLKFIKE